MDNKQPDNTDTSPPQPPWPVPPSPTRKNSRPLLLLVFVFVAFVITVFVIHREKTINWIEDYDAGLEMAKQQEKNILLAFDKKLTRFSSEMWQRTYNNPDVIKFVESNFVPILIDVDKQPDIAKPYNVTTYPSHFVLLPDTHKIVGFHVGSDVPAVFINKLKDQLKKIDAPPK
jgi:hypothetical protein